jgi:Na+-transporting methylmalonyl-CoA/oxaloacetate decarboxylase gamma subunit
VSVLLLLLLLLLAMVLIVVVISRHAWSGAVAMPRTAPMLVR